MIIDIPLQELIAEGSDGAASKIGGTVINLLALWHRDLFGNWKVEPKSTSHQLPDSYDLALHLITHALKTKNSLFRDAIQSLLEEAAPVNEDAREYLASAWPHLRDRLSGTRQ
jgi:hypothetical protein